MEFVFEEDELPHKVAERADGRTFGFEVFKGIAEGKAAIEHEIPHHNNRRSIETSCAMDVNDVAFVLHEGIVDPSGRLFDDRFDLLDVVFLHKLKEHFKVFCVIIVVLFR